MKPVQIYQEGDIILVYENPYYQEGGKEKERIRIGMRPTTTHSTDLLWENLVAGKDLGGIKFDNRFSNVSHVDITYNPRTKLVDEICIASYDYGNNSCENYKRNPELNQEAKGKLEEALEVFESLKLKIKDLRTKKRLEEVIRTGR